MIDKKLQEKIDKGMLRLKEISEELIEIGVPCALLVPNPYPKKEDTVLIYTQMQQDHLKTMLGSAFLQIGESYKDKKDLGDIGLDDMKG